MKKHGLGQPYWNAHQVYTWVYTRNPRLVVLLSDRDEGDSVGPGIIDFFAMTGRPGAEFADYAEAQEAIVSTLQEGRLRSLGRREGAGALEEIPAVEWVDLHFVWSVFHGSAEAVGMTDDPPSSIVGAPRWYGLKFKRDDVFELWPPTETEIETGAEDPPAQMLPPHDESDPQEPAETPMPEVPEDEPKTFRERTEEWLEDMEGLRETHKISWHKAAEQIAGRAGVDTATVEREARRIRQERGKKRENF